MTFEENTIVVGDCLEVMAGMPDGCVDLVVADPPFNVKFDYGSDFDDNKPLQEYLDLLVAWMAEAERICKEGRLLFLWQAMLHCLSAWNRFPQARLMAGCKNFVQIRKVDVQWAFDPILFWNKGETAYEFAKKGQMGMRRDWHVGQTCKWVLDKETGWHPCPRPIDTVEYIVGQWSNKGDLIFDPFMGSGTTAWGGVGSVVTSTLTTWRCP